jgi:ParB family transcriptional regulator, chromosome partitioning protein
MIKRTGLGKGMAALLQSADEEGKSFFACPIEDIRPNRSQPRKTFSNEKLEELAASIREKGIIQPLVVRRKTDHYELIAGERRWRAAQKAGLREVPVVIQDVSDGAALEMALIENIQREDLNAVEEAEAYQALLDNFDLSQEDLARRVGKERSTVANALRLLKLPAEIKRDIAEERLTMGHARALLALDSPEQMKRGRDEILGRHLTVRQAEGFVKKLKTGKKTQKPATPTEPHLADIVEQLKRHFKARVALRQTGRGGRLEISYTNLEDLTRIIEILKP